MIKLPKEVNKIINKLTNEGYQVYCAGECVTASYVGGEPQDWDLYTDCPQEKLRQLFPDGEKLGRRVTRLDHTTEVLSDDINVADSIEGIIADIVTLEGSMEEQLEIYDLTVEAIAEHPQKSPIDPYGGRADIKEMILKPVGDMDDRIRRDPVTIFKAIKYVALYNFDLHKSLSDAIRRNGGALLQEADKEAILDDFTLIINGDYAGKALKMIAGLGLLPALVGEKAAAVGRREAQDYEKLTENIDRVKHIPLRRQGLFYSCFDRHYQEAVEHLPYEGLDREYLLEARQLLKNIHFLGTDEAIKRFLYRCGWDKYNFVDKLSKAQAAVFDLNTQRIEGRDYMLKIILKEKQPIFVEDLKIDAEDILESGITDDPQRAAYLLGLLPDVVHQKPGYNERKTLLKYARKFNKSKLSVAFRDVKWLR